MKSAATAVSGMTLFSMWATARLRNFSPEEKDAVSHRGNALRKLAKELPEYLK